MTKVASRIMSGKETPAYSVFIQPSAGLCGKSPLIGPNSEVTPADGVGRTRVGVGVGWGAPASSDGIRCCAVLPDMAKPNPSTPISEYLKVLIPKILPETESIGPPLLPGFMAASVWITSLWYIES